MQKPQIVILYPTRQAHPQSTFSVARLCGLLAEAISKAGFEVLLVTRAGSLPLAESAVVYKTIAPASPWQHKLLRLLWSAKKLRQRELDGFNRQAQAFVTQQGFTKPLFVSPAIAPALYFARHFSPRQVFLWTHNYPDAQTLPSFLKGVKLPLNLITPSRALYDLIWQRLHENVLPFSYYFIPNHIAQAPETATIETVTTQASDKLKLFHGSGSGLNKGLHFIQKLLPLLPEKVRQNLHFTFVGQKNRTFQLGDIACTELVKMPKPALMQQLVQADIGIMSSLWFENAPVMLQEYLEAGLIPIASQSGGNAEMLEGYHGQLVGRPNEVEAWVEALVEISNWPAEKRAKYKQENKERFAQQNAGLNDRVTTAWLQAFSAASEE